MTLADSIMGRSLLVRRSLALALLPLAVLRIWVCLFVPAKSVETSQATWREQPSAELARARGHAELLEPVRQELEGGPSQPVWQRLCRVEQGADGDVVVQRDVASVA